MLPESGVNIEGEGEGRRSPLVLIAPVSSFDDTSRIAYCCSSSQ